MTDSVLGAAPAPVPADAASPGWPDTLAPPGAPAADGNDGATDTGDAARDEAAPDYAVFDLPEGVQVDDATLDAARGLFAEAKLPQEAAQRFVDFYADRIRAVAEAPHKVWAQTQEQWVREVNRDAEIGGDRLKGALNAAGRAIDAFGSPRLREVLTFTGAGNHPEVVRFFARVGKAISEDGHIPGSAARAHRSAAEIMFPTMREQE
jgi:hypothetical protein